MPTYEWLCQHCKNAVMETNRRIANRNDGPTIGCPECGSSDWKRMISVPSRIVAEDHNRPFPICMKGLDKGWKKNPDGTLAQVRQTDPKTGREYIGPQRTYGDVVFRNAQEQREGLEQRGMVLAAEAYDPMVGPSQNSVFNKPDDCPSPNAMELVRKGRYLEGSEIKKMMECA